MSALLLIGGSDEQNGDHSRLRAAAASARRRLPKWSTLKKAVAGDEIWFYVPRPVSAIVAAGTAAGVVRPGSGYWPYDMPVVDVRMLPEPVSLRTLRRRFPAWEWTVAARQRTYLPERVAKFLRSVTPPEGVAAPARPWTLLGDEALESEFCEGQRLKVSVNRYERDAGARAACISHHGSVCVICNVDLARIYGPVAERLVHVHHIKPLAKIGRQYRVNSARDLIPVCPNCHAVIHQKDPPLSPRAMRVLIERHRAAGRGRGPGR